MAIKARAFFVVGPLPFCVCLCMGAVDNGAGKQANQVEIQRYSQAAERAMAVKDLDAAAVALKKLAALTPQVPEVFANLGMVYYSENHYLEAAQAFEQALKLDPRIANGTLMLGLCDAEVGRWQQARPILESAFRHPPNQQIGRTIGIKLMETYSFLDRNFKALETSEELLGRYPNDAEILYRASHLYGDRALETMNRLVEIAPQSPWKLMAFAEALEGQKHYDVAITQYRRVIVADPAMPGAHYRLGRSLLLRNRDSEGAREEAMGEFQKALAQDPRNAGAEYEIGELYRRRGDSGQAAGHFLKAAEIEPHFEEAQIALARILMSLKRPQEAVPHLEAAIRLNRGNEVSHYYLARADRTLGDNTGAEHEMTAYRECHARSLRGASAAEDQTPNSLTAPPVTRQTVESENRD